MTYFPVGKLPPPLLAQLLAGAPGGPDVVVGPALGVDCAIVRVGDRLLALKSDPITFASEELGWYLVQVNANDLATVGAVPRWLLVTLLLPEGATDADLVRTVMDEIYAACREMDVAVVGGHTEITYGLERPLAVGTMIGEVPPGKLVTPRGAKPGDRLLLTKTAPLEGAAILAREFRDELQERFTDTEIAEAAGYLRKPGIGVLRDAQVALAHGTVHAMHDPTEGGIATGLWELAEASGHALLVDRAAIPVSPLAARLCAAFDLDPLATIASGALLLAVPPGGNAASINAALQLEGIPCHGIGRVIEGEPAVWQERADGRQLLARPERDDLARLFDRRSAGAAPGKPTSVQENATL